MRFSYVVKDTKGKTINGTDDAPHEEALVDLLQKQGYYVLKIQPFSETAAQKPSAPIIKKKFSHVKTKLDDLLIFCRQLGTMIDAGVTLIRAIDILSVQVDSKQLSQALAMVKKDIEHGNSLSSSLAKYPKIFNQFWVSLIEVGEASGTMPIVLEKLAFYMEQQAAFRSSIVSAIIYPAILMLVATGAIFFFALVIGPRFKSLFESFHVQLPALTAVLLTTFEVIRTKFLVLVGVLCVIFILVKQFVKTPAGRVQLENFLFSLPTFGNIYKTILVERFTSQMSILVDSGVPILYALDITQRMIGNSIFETVIGNIKNGVREGKFLASQMSESNYFPPMAVQMIMVGEETGELGKMLKRVSEYYQNTVSTFMKRFGTIFEPIMLVVMGAAIGVIVIAMFLPIFSITQFGSGGTP